MSLVDGIHEPSSIEITEASRIKVAPLTPCIGAEISGIDLSAPIDDIDVKAIQATWYRYKVIFFRDAFVSQQRMYELADIFGGPSVGDTFADGKYRKDDDHPGVMRLFHDKDRGRGQENQWHSDSMFWAEPPRGAIISCRESPDLGGDTLWADMGAAYASLSEEMQGVLRPLYAVHDVSISASIQYATDPKALEKAVAKFPLMRHPLIRTHPITGTPSIYASAPNTRYIEGMDRAESDALLGRLFALASVPEFQCRFRWSEGTLAVWDNRTTQHYAVFDYAPKRRVMERIFLAGEKPV